ncbi:peptide chain release factor N(5)-glutamine methyltransferase [Terrimonas sp. NA20]|uniref:Release factor glutamine methyltransferase n=1 Tax=Terrimonas ginsenosidimutans TaxID=2908004 RepID=A0ABS9KYF7_9BACT|nr:peptide chain release factor N(5)-glutamine methyltransferase [Terrimonas ginsenosidimutans]MCG2617267.1 peptide chain release factor N(5)-glutamine methyltransferase [Terrimonas ginsenosidimutans]
MTIQEARRHGMQRLSAIYATGEASTISDWVIEHITGTKAQDRYSGAGKELGTEQSVLLDQLLERLLTHEPVQYVLGEAWFSGLRFKVDPNVLIPRPETEELVEWVIDHCKFPLGDLNILDVGTGSGCIAISLKRRLGKGKVWACDLSAGALALAAENARTLGADVHFVELDFLSADARAALPAFDIIISNPPYIPERDKSDMHSNVLGYEPHMALFVPDDDGLLFYRAIAAFGKTHLKKDGAVYVEIYEGAGQATLELFRDAGYTAELKRDMQGKDRMIRGVLD